ncbi:MAG: 50S ribosomal protein L9 [Anaerolineae bacterium]|nr:50S ribosomal protein L9 [Anaerolineae bacterium]
MKIILTQTVHNLGKAGEIKDVNAGYARNYLIPQGLATPATPGAINQFKSEQKAVAKREARLAAEAAGLVEQLNAVTLTFEAKAGPTGRLYGSVTTVDMAEALEQQTGTAFDRRKIMSDPLRDVGTHVVPVEVVKGAIAQIKVVVKAEGGEAGGQEAQEPAPEA